MKPIGLLILAAVVLRAILSASTAYSKEHVNFVYSSISGVCLALGPLLRLHRDEFEL